MFARTRKMAFWVTYDHLGKLLVGNVLTMAALLAPMALGYAAGLSGEPAVAVLIGAPVAILVFGIILPAAAAGTAYMAKELIETKDGSIATFFTGLRRYAGRAVRIGLAYMAAVACLVSSVWFYAVRLGATAPWLGYALSAVALWALIFAALTAMLIMPALVQKGAGAMGTLRLSALLVVDNPLFCLGLGIHCGLLAALCLLPPVLILFSIAPMIVLVSSAYEILSRKYAALEALRATGDTALAASQARVKIDFHDAEDDYLNRGFRDFLFPWKG